MSTRRATMAAAIFAVSAMLGSVSSATSAPGAPRDVVATPGPSIGQITITWSPPSDNGGAPILGYSVCRAESSPACVTLPASASLYTDSGLTPLTLYSYAVSARNSAGYGPSGDACTRPYPWDKALDLGYC